MRSRFTLFLFLLSLYSLASCHKNDPEPPGPLEGSWKATTVDWTEYDQQGKVVIAYPTSKEVEYMELVISANEIIYIDNKSPYSTTSPGIPYTRSGNEIISSMSNLSCTIKKLTLTDLELLYAQAPQQIGNKITHYEQLYRFKRK